MKRALLLCALLGLPARAGTYASGDVVVVEDASGAIHQNVSLDNQGGFSMLSTGGRFCRDTAKEALPVVGDNFDGLVTFSTETLNDLTNVQQGQPVRWSTQGIGSNSFDWGAQFGSAAKLSHCVFMGSLGRLPANPDGPATAMFGLPLGISAVELVGHEYGHHWLLWVQYDKADGKGPQILMRGYESNAPNGHYNYNSDGLSVMYGNKVTDLGGGQFKLEGGDRKFSQMDQYLMGLRAPSEVQTHVIVDIDGSGQGVASAPISKGASGSTVSGTKVLVDVADVVRVHGPRVPAYPNAQSCWRVAFVLVAKPGTTASAADIAKVDAYRRRFEAWFSWATDGRGTMQTNLTGTACQKVAVVPDAGTPTVDAGQPAPDAGEPAVEPDAGAAEPDAGLQEQPPEEPMDGGYTPDKWDTWVDLGNTQLKPGCGCGAGLGAEAFALLALLGLARRRRG